jgi:hypothetical protein
MPVRCASRAVADVADEVVLLDPTPLRRTAAEGLGLTALDPDRGDVAVALKSRWQRGPGDRGADVVFQCRGPAPPWRWPCGCCARRAR